MSKSDIAVSVRGLSKSYTIAHQGERHVTLAESLLARARRPFARTPKETFWALKDVSFDIRKGDVVGIIGRNGAGKSTLLKILSRITEPTAGTIDLYGRVGSLLEVGTGFHPELTGRENVFLNGAILGMTKAEIRKQFDAIVDFAGVEQFLDTPVKRYSSGMYVRLAFAVAAHLNSDILILDEVLAVGDSDFQRKCLGKMQDVALAGRTVLFVSHNMMAVSGLCSNGMLIQSGRIAFAGSVADTIGRHLASHASEKLPDQDERKGSGEYRFVQLEMDKGSYKGNESRRLLFRFQRVGHRIPTIYLSAHAIDACGNIIVQYDSRLTNFQLHDSDGAAGELVFNTPWLKPGEYRLDVGICSAGLIDLVESSCPFKIDPETPYGFVVPPDALQYGLTLGDFQWSTR